MATEKYDGKIDTVGELVKILLNFPQNARLLATWEGIGEKIKHVTYEEKEFTVLMNVDVE